MSILNHLAEALVPCTTTSFSPHSVARLCENDRFKAIHSYDYVISKRESHPGAGPALSTIRSIVTPPWQPLQQLKCRWRRAGSGATKWRRGRLPRGVGLVRNRLRCTAPACIDAPLAAAILSVYKQAERVPVDAALEGSPEAQRVVRAITCAGLDAQ